MKRHVYDSEYLLLMCFGSQEMSALYTTCSSKWHDPLENASENQFQKKEYFVGVGI